MMVLVDGEPEDKLTNPESIKMGFKLSYWPTSTVNVCIGVCLLMGGGGGG